MARLKIGERFFAVFAVALLLENKDRQGPEKAQISSGHRFGDHATIFILGAIASMVLAVFNAPVVPSQLQ